MDEKKLETLKDQIWSTRISRINAEKRILGKEQYIQFVNIYYSCITIIFSIMAFVNHDDKLSLLTIYMTISLLVSIVYLTSKNYTHLARKFRDNYTDLQQLEFKLSHLTLSDEEELKSIETSYCKFLKESENHITFDYYCTLYKSNDEYKAKKKWKSVSRSFYWGVIWRFIVKLFFVVLPIILFLFRSFM